MTSWMVASTSSELERWRGETVPIDPSWSDIESIDRTGRQIDDDQAEFGYRGGMETHDRQA